MGVFWRLSNPRSLSIIRVVDGYDRFITRMKIALFGIAEIKPGKHNLKDPRMDQADKLVEADKKTYAQVELVGEEELLDADAILALAENKADLILKDLEFVETRLGRDPQAAERAALEKIRALLEAESFLFNCGLAPEDLQAVAAHNFFTSKPITVASAEELQSSDSLLLRAFRESGYISFLTVGGKENRGSAYSQRCYSLGSCGEHPHRSAEGLYPSGDHRF